MKYSDFLTSIFSYKKARNLNDKYPLAFAMPYSWLMLINIVSLDVILFASIIFCIVNWHFNDDKEKVRKENLYVLVSGFIFMCMTLFLSPLISLYISKADAPTEQFDVMTKREADKLPASMQLNLNYGTFADFNPPRFSTWGN